MKNRVEMLLMSKRQLEDYGRSIGIELDRRRTKTHLIKELLDHGKSVVSASVSIPDIDSVPLTTIKASSNMALDTETELTKYNLVRSGDFWSVSLGDKQVYKSSSEHNAKSFMERHS
jgi:hypothetical protein|tara:strand:- start:122 stop:472 length:351 start_codon:yes stop_codon:yes gene_type:complete